MLFTSKRLNIIDKYFYASLLKSVDVMPKRFVKLIAYYYPDARIRKVYFKKLGLYMGENTYANLGLKVVVNTCNAEERISVGKNVSIAPNVTFVADSDANNGDLINKIQYVKEKLTIKGKRITVDDEVWIGANVTIFPNTHIGKCAIIGAGSVVTKDVKPFTIVAGIPAKTIRTLTPPK